MSSIIVKNAVKKFGNSKNSDFVLNELNLRVENGSIYALIGASGCGKTTLISCILGMISLDKGEIEVLSEKITHKKSNQVTRRIGYMPQKIELVAQLTTKETLKYFGKVFQMDDEEFFDRYEMLKDLLEINFEDQLISEISGGEQRRVSFAVAFIHNPRVLILDEPTVGLDVILRNKIWNFMLDVTKSKNLSILITTHYIVEAQMASRCGFMRGGTLIAEDSPSNIIAKLKAVNLDESFLKLCTGEETKKCFLEPKSGFEDVDMTAALNNANENKKVTQRKYFSRSTMGALFKKEILRVKRSGELYLLVILPLAQILTLAFAVGRAPTGLKLGVVNKEIQEYFSTNLSTKFLETIPDEKAIKVFYDSFDEAYKDVKNGKLIGFIYLPTNFTEIFLESNKDIDERNIYTTNAIDVHLDKSNHQLSWFVTQTLYDSYFQFDKELFNKSHDDYPIKVKPWFGEFTFDFRLSIFTTFISGAIFLCSITSTSNCLTASRDEGVWNRTLLAGVKVSEILATHLAVLTCQNLFQILEIIFISGILIEPRVFDNFVMILAMFMSIATVGSSYALLVSILVENFLALSMVNVTVFMLIMVLSGTIWPLEGQPAFLQYFSFMLPTTIPSISGRDILVKNLELLDWTVQRGFIILAFWFATTYMVTLVVLKKKKFV